MSQFHKLQEYLNRPYAYHAIDETVNSAAHRLLNYFTSNEEFNQFNSSLNSQDDVRSMFNEMTDQWISDNYLDVSSTDDRAIEKYNILTDSDINAAIKDDVFSILWNNK